MAGAPSDAVPGPPFEEFPRGLPVALEVAETSSPVFQLVTPHEVLPAVADAPAEAALRGVPVCSACHELGLDAKLVVALPLSDAP